MFLKTGSLAVCTASFLYTFYVLIHLTYFLSRHSSDFGMSWMQAQHPMVHYQEGPVLFSLLVNMSLLSLFMLQHTVMAKEFMKNLFCKLHIQYLDRSLYNAASAAVLHLLLTHWQVLPSTAFWNMTTSSNIPLWFFFTGLHVLTWAIIYSGCLMMDISELAGLKQVYFKISGRPSPVSMKSKELIRFYKHMRHPSFVGFLVILWIHPFMTLDRFLLASVLTIYMAMRWNIDEADYKYHATFVKLKKGELF